jgi:hypothetical protein
MIYDARNPGLNKIEVHKNIHKQSRGTQKIHKQSRGTQKIYKQIRGTQIYTYVPKKSACFKIFFDLIGLYQNSRSERTNFNRINPCQIFVTVPSQDLDF